MACRLTFLLLDSSLAALEEVIRLSCIVVNDMVRSGALEASVEFWGGLDPREPLSCCTRNAWQRADAENGELSSLA